MSNPDNASAPPELQQTLLAEWRDQYVVAIGTEYHFSPKNTFRFGYNYGRNPTPSKRMTPTLNGTAQHHLTLGSSHRMDNDWLIHTAVEYIVKSSVTYTNPDLPFGTNTEDHGEAISFYITSTKRW